MKKLIVLAAMSISANAFASADAYYTDCKKNESDKECVQRIVKESDVMTQNFYTGKESERPMIYNAIYGKANITLIQEAGEGGTVFTSYLLVYKVSGTELSGLKAAAFSVTLEKSLEDTGKKPKVVGRSILSSSIKILTGATEE
ncbi:MAG: hypothetical protein V4596_06590 [Bdellovibrionota bacterium]